MNGRCHNDPMDFATDVCDSCGEQFCMNCLVFPRGPKKAPFCTHCAMALSGVRNRRPVKPLPRGEIKKRRKQLRAQLAEHGDDVGPRILPGTELIDAPAVEASLEEASNQSGGLIGRLRRRKVEPPEPTVDHDPPEPMVTVVGTADDVPDAHPIPPPEYHDPADGPMEAEVESDLVPSESASATAILEQLKEHGNDSDDSVWLPPAVSENTTWTLPDLQQSPLGTGGPWEGVANTPVVDEPVETALDPTPAMAEAAPIFVSEKELKSQGPADTDTAGNWVPPTLRGMAPAAGSNGDELPRRRRRTQD